MKIEFFRHNIDADVKASVAEVLDSLFLTTGEWVNRFEQDLARYVGADYCIGLTSCTAALHLSLLALGIGPGDQVITTPMTFASSSLAVLHTGAQPVWVDVEADTGNINVDLIEEAVTEKTRAILPVHLYGQMCDMVGIREIADRHGLYIVEDAAHALESQREGIRVGELGHTACFSFYPTKSITSGEGGAVTTDSKALADKLRVLRQHGMSKEAADRYSKRYEHWDLVEAGWKYNMDNIQAAMLLPQLPKADGYHARRKEIFETYHAGLAEVPGIDLPRLYENSINGYHLFTIWVDPSRRDKILRGLQDKGIGVAVNYRSINLLTKFKEIFGQGRGSFPQAERIGDSTITLPLYPKLTSEEINYVIKSVIETVGTA